MSKSTFRRWGALVPAILIYSPLSQSQSALPEDEVRKLIRVSEDVQPLGENPFGEQVSLYNGSTRFLQTDISASGQGPLLQLSRAFDAPDYNPDVLAQPFLANELVDWSLELPRLETLSAVYDSYPPGGGKPQKKWFFSEDANRCTRFTQGPDISLPSKPGSEEVQWPAQDWWLGYQLHIPGQARQDVLYRLPGNDAVPSFISADGSPMLFPGATKQHWRLGCLPGASNDGGDGFLAVGPDGTKYTLNYVLRKPAAPIGRPGGGGLERQLVKLMATRVEDRFGNAISYGFDGAGNVVSIDASDGRKLALSYEPWTHGSGRYPMSYRLASATLQPESGAARTWRYTYTGEALPRLAAVVQPDGSSWAFNMAGLRSPGSDPVVNYLGCSVSINSGAESSSAVTMTGPTGLSGTFNFHTTVRGRGNVQYACLQDGALGESHLGFQNLYTVAAITGKSYTGAGIGTQTWQYSYSPPNASWDTECGACESEVWSDVIDPAGNATRSVFSNRADVTESRLRRVDQFAGGVGGPILRQEAFEYAARDRGPWPARLGATLQYRMNDAQNESLTPLTRHDIYVDGNRYSRSVDEFDAFAQDITVTQTNDIPGQVSKTERTSRLNDASHWLLGLPSQVDSLTTGETVAQFLYEPSRITLSDRYSFGRRVMSYRFDGGGQLDRFVDGNGHATELGGYKRGVPQWVSYPDGTSQSLDVDEFGQITSVTNQSGSTTTYGYTEMGRLRTVTPPVNDSTPWNAKEIVYSFGGDGERSVSGPHWRRFVTEGDRVQVTHFDALMQPVLADVYRSDGAFYTSARTDYDWRGRTTFQSYPFSGAPALHDMYWGKATAYDALGRAVRTIQHSELGDLATTTEYLGGAGRRRTDPKGNVTTTWYQVFENPESDHAIRINAPEGVDHVIARDVYGNPLEITQGGGGIAATKTFSYDGHHRLCRVWEPESGSSIMARDGADNVTWTVSGASYTGAGCAYELVDEGAKTWRFYDAMDRVTSIIYPHGTTPATFTYDPAGNLATATSGDVGWTYGRNRRGMLTTEVLYTDGNVWSFDYGYDKNGALSWMGYPDGDVVNFDPDALGRPSRAGNYAWSAAYFPDGTLGSYAMGSGATYSAERNSRSLLRNLTYGHGGTPVISEDFAYDANGNISSVSDLVGSGQRSKTLSYDGLDRLRAAIAPNLWGVEEYAYDPLNNIRTISNAAATRTFHYDANNLLASVDGLAGGTFRHDARGNVIAKGSDTFDYDLANRIVKFRGVEQYDYDAFARRVRKATPAGTTYYAYGSSGQLLWEVNKQTRLGTGYVYLGGKLVAKATENIDILKPSQVRTQLTIVGVPKLSLDGKTIEAVVDIANSGTRPLSREGSYPVQLGYHLVDPQGHQSQVEDAVSIPSDIPVGGHLQMAARVAAGGVLGTGNTIQFSLVQPGVAWFQDWPGNDVARIGPYSDCLKPGTGRLCNNVTGLTPEQVNVALSLRAPPRLSEDGNTVVLSVGMANAGSVTLSPVGPLSVQLRADVMDSSGGADPISLQEIPETPPGESAAVSIEVPSTKLIGSGYALRAELQQGDRRFSTLGATPLSAGPFVTPVSPPLSTDGGYSVTWTPIEGAVRYALQEQVDGGVWITVADGVDSSWSTAGRATGTYVYQVQACTSQRCLPFGVPSTTRVLLPPPIPLTATATAPVSGPTTLNWAASPTATQYVVQQHFNFGEWQTIYDGGGVEAVFGTPVDGVYGYRVQACNSSGCSGFQQSNDVAITYPPSDAPGIAGGGINHTGAYQISWSGVARASAYNLVEFANGGGPQQVQFDGATAWGTAGRWEGTYVYQVQACNVAGCGPWSDQTVVTVALPPPTPTNVQVIWKSLNPKRETLTMTWDATPLVAYYQIFDLSAQEMFAPSIPAGTHTLLLESAPPPLPSHAYQLRACNAVGCSEWTSR
jgi:YD repeat-containing protein